MLSHNYRGGWTLKCLCWRDGESVFLEAYLNVWPCIQNQSMVQQFTRAGNFLRFNPKCISNVSHMRIYMQLVMQSTNKHVEKIGASACFVWFYHMTHLWTFWSYCYISCFHPMQRESGTSPAFSRLLTSSRNDSFLIYICNRKTPSGLPFFSIFLRSLLNLHAN